MPDIPSTIEQDLAADRNSKPYRGHPLCTVRQFCKLSYLDQRRIDREAEELHGKVRQWKPATPTKPAHWLVLQEGTWIEQPAT